MHAASPTAAHAADPSTLRVWVRHLLAFYVPGQALLFLATGPHPWWLAWLFILPLVAAHFWDLRSPAETRQPAPELPSRAFDALVYALGVLHLVNTVLWVRLFAEQSLFSLDLLIGHVIVGGAAGYSIITAHELIHRPPLAERLFGRLLLCTVLYEHFYTEHVRGHHVRVGLPDDPATARFGETYEHFFRRTVPAQFQSAWRLETQRLGDPDMRLLDARQLHNRVLQGLVVEWAIALLVLATLGFASFAAYLIQALVAIRLLEVVNYFEHWGLTRRDPKRPGPQESWDTHSRFTYYGLIGLSRHADHHQFASRPYQQLRYWPEAPVLPRGYVALIPLVLLGNREFQHLAIEELRRRRLGPFASE
jgi:alkane 1-monooxygenase